jgi:hypothetical protein
MPLPFLIAKIAILIVTLFAGHMFAPLIFFDSDVAFGASMSSNEEVYHC